MRVPVEVEQLVQDINNKGYARDVFMMLYRYSDPLKETMTAEDCKEVFLSVLLGREDLSRALLEELCLDYGTSLSEVLGEH